MLVRCAGERPDGRPCGAWPMRGEAYCLWHSPDREEEAAEARRLGGLRRRREKTVAGAYDFEGLGSVPALRRLLEIGAVDTLSLDNGIARTRAIVAVVQAGTKLLETGELEERVAALEAALRSAATTSSAPSFELDPGP